MKNNNLKIETKYPKGYEERDGRIYHKDEEVSNCTIRILDYSYHSHTDSGSTELTWKVAFVNADPSIAPTILEIPVSKLESTTTVTQEKLGLNSIYLSKTQIPKLMMETLRRSTSNIKPNEYLYAKQGTFTIGDDAGIAIGDKTILSMSKYQVINESPHKLKELPEKENKLNVISRITNLDYFQPAIIIVSLSMFLYPFFNREMRRRLQFAGYIYGPTGSGKTAQGVFVTDFFSDRDNIISLLSDGDIYNKLSSFPGTPVLADDLCGIKCRNFKEKLEEVVGKLVQLLQSGGHILDKGKEIKIDGMLFITAVDVVKSLCTVNRCILIKMIAADPNVDTSELDELQPQYILVVLDFVEWLYANYDRLLREIPERFKNKWVSYPSSGIYFGYHRIINTWKLLLVTLDVFMEFLHGKSEYVIDPIRPAFESSIQECINDTFAHVDVHDYIKYFRNIKRLYDCCHLDKLGYVTNKLKEFTRINIDGGNDFIILNDKEEDSYILSGAFLSEIFDGLSPQGAAKILIELGLLRQSDVESEGNTYTIKGQSKNSRKYYHIDKDAIKAWNADYKFMGDLC